MLTATVNCKGPILSMTRPEHPSQTLPGSTVDADHLLVQQAKAGVATAFEELYRKHSPLAARVIQRITKNASDTDDVLQDTFLRAFVHLKDFDGRSRFSTWLLRIAVNSALMMNRKKGRRLEYSMDGSPDEAPTARFQMADAAPGPESECANAYEIAKAAWAVQSLAPPMREVTMLRYAADLPLRDIAFTVGISIGATKSRLHRAHSRLQKKLAPLRTPACAARYRG